MAGDAALGTIRVAREHDTAAIPWRKMWFLLGILDRFGLVKQM
jgi:hypothetical protein